VIRAVLFDLDGTLLRIDTARFVDAYVHLLADWFAPRIPKERFLSSLLMATQRMMTNRDPARTNKAVFDDAFYPSISVSADEMAAPLAEFYAQAYPSLAKMTAPDPAAREAVSIVLARGLTPVLATQPIFPAVAVRQRMAWAGIADLPFALVTTYEVSHACKPHPEYFTEVTATIGCAPGECLFIGNDGEEDAVARRLGMETYLVTDFLTNRARVQARNQRMGALRTLPRFLASFVSSD
jgi:FMN phosphatase YigB (HAD superfamily)